MFMKFDDIVNEALSRLSPVKLYRGANPDEDTSSEVERPFMKGGEFDFRAAFMTGDVDEVIFMLRKHVGDSGARAKGIKSYSLSKDVAKSFVFNNDIIKELDIPAKNIISSRQRLQTILSLPDQQKQQLLDQGVGFNVNRLISKFKFAASDPDSEQEIMIYKK
jgi:hypothetical protein